MSKLILCCGAPASGKTFHSKLFVAWSKHRAIRLSSDELRGIIGTDESDQSVSPAVFRTLEYTVEHLLRQGYTVVVDACNINKKNRKVFLEIAKSLASTTEAVVFDVPIEELKRRNAARERIVPENVIESMVARFEMPTQEEGFDKVVVIPFAKFEGEPRGKSDLVYID